MKQYFYQPLGTDIRSYLVRESIQRAEAGKNTLYLAPSREIIFTVRDQIEALWGGSMHIQVGGFEDLERLLLSGTASGETIDQETAQRMIQYLCQQSREVDARSLFGGVADKEGLARLVYGHIKRLKRCNITPEELRERMATMDPDSFLCKAWFFIGNVYESYQNMLEIHHRTDVDDLSMQAVRAVPGPGTKLPDLLVLDGYFNIDPVHRDMLMAVFGRHPELDCMVGISYYTKAADAFVSGELIRDLHDLGFERKEPELFEAVQMVAMDLATHLFAMDAPPGERNPDVHILDMPCLEDEVRQILHRVKELLMERDVPPEKVALVVRDQEVYQEALTRIAEELKIPLHMTALQPLHTSHLVKDILRALDGVSMDSQDKTKNLSILSAASQADEQEEWLSAFWPESATGEQYAAILQSWLEKIKPAELILELRRGHVVKEGWLFRELKALDAFSGMLESMVSSFKMMKNLKTITAFDFLQRINREVEERSVSEARPLGGVKVLDPDLLRGVSYDHVFFMGLNDGVFPRTGQPDLFAGVPLDELNRINLPVHRAFWELEREKIRFLSVCAAAREQLVFSYRTAKEDGSFWLPSSFLQTAADYLSTKLHSRRTMRDRYDLKIEDVSSQEEAIRWWSGKRAWNGGSADEIPWDEMSANGVSQRCRIEGIIAAVAIEKARESSHPPDRYDGNLQGVTLAQQEDTYRYSASQLNEYRRCPFRYFSSRVLGLKTTMEDEMNPLFLGNLYHAVLAAYYSQDPENTELNESWLEKCLQQNAAAMDQMPYHRLFLGAKQNEIRENLTSFLRHDLKYRQSFREVAGTDLVPAYLEWRLEDGEIDGCRFNANIDRVDLEMAGGKPTGRFVVYDYKTKSINSFRDILKGDDLQLPLYALLTTQAVVRALGNPQACCLAVLSYSITKKEKKGMCRDDWRKALGLRTRGIHPKLWDPLMDGFKQRILRTVAKIREGRFELPEVCPYQGEFTPYTCDYRYMCRYHPERMIRKGGACHDES
jgi:ATP-dependent helicase/nuclease subunit B